MRRSANLSWLVPGALVALAAFGPPGAGAGEPEREEARCWPATETCPAKAYERKAAQAASNAAEDRFGRDFPPAEWTVTCYPGESSRRIECSFHSRDPVPYDCVGGAKMVKRDGRWRARNVQMSCRPG